MDFYVVHFNELDKIFAFFMGFKLSGIGVLG